MRVTKDYISWQISPVESSSFNNITIKQLFEHNLSSTDPQSISTSILVTSHRLQYLASNAASRCSWISANKSNASHFRRFKIVLATTPTSHIQNCQLTFRATRKNKLTVSCPCVCLILYLLTWNTVWALPFLWRPPKHNTSEYPTIKWPINWWSCELSKWENLQRILM